VTAPPADVPANPAAADTPNRATRPSITDRAWFDRPALEVAPDLLGRRIAHHAAEGVVAGRIVETEAYAGPEDLAAHSSHGRTARTQTLFGAPGHLYVYLVYGIHHCINVVCGPGTKPEAVLIRAVALDEGLALARDRRGSRVPAERLAAGPGNVAQALGIDRSLDGVDLLSGPVTITDGIPPTRISRRPRVGVAYAAAWAALPYRFLVTDDPHVSRR
jgi:DNA-3-methyladenine glycosylase